MGPRLLWNPMFESSRSIRKEKADQVEDCFKTAAETRLQASTHSTMHWEKRDNRMVSRRREGIVASGVFDRFLKLGEGGSAPAAPVFLLSCCNLQRATSSFYAMCTRKVLQHLNISCKNCLVPSVRQQKNV